TSQAPRSPAHLPGEAQSPEKSSSPEKPMTAAESEIKRLKRLHQFAHLELILLSALRSPTLQEEQEVIRLTRNERLLEERIAWLEAIANEHAEND
ncbi:MAG TPA: hypothetical protein VG963_11600, partial [Polyangiaceae bacterium]|nr:hypothetical protein [Polyangiaceae bacterium]